MRGGFYHPERGYWEPTGEISAELVAAYPAGTIKVPTRPSHRHVWTGSGWAYSHLSAERERAAWREAAWLPRHVFCVRLLRAGLLPEEDCIQAARGDWPAALQDMLAALPPAEAAEARILWAASPQIYREHPLLLQSAKCLGATPEQLDTLFGWRGAA